MREASSDASLLPVPKVCNQDGPSLHVDWKLRRTWKHEALLALLELHFYYRSLLVQHLLGWNPQMLRLRHKSLPSWKNQPSRISNDEQSDNLFWPLLHFLYWFFLPRSSHLAAKSHKKEHERYRQASTLGSSEADVVWTKDFTEVIWWKIRTNKRRCWRCSKQFGRVYGKE